MMDGQNTMENKSNFELAQRLNEIAAEMDQLEIERLRIVHELCERNPKLKDAITDYSKISGAIIAEEFKGTLNGAGFAIADFTVSKIIFASLSFAMYWLLVMIKITLLPFITLFGYTKRLMKSIIGKVNTRVVETQFIRYARKRHNDLEKIKQTGMLKF